MRHLRPGSAKQLLKARNVAKVREKLEIQYPGAVQFLEWFFYCNYATYVPYYACLLSLMQDNLYIWLNYDVGIFLMLIFTKFKITWSLVEQHCQVYIGEALCTSLPPLWRIASLLGDESGHSPRRWAAIKLGGVSRQMGHVQESLKHLMEAGSQQNGWGELWDLESGWQQKCEGNLLKSVLRLKAAGQWQGSHKGHCSHSTCATPEGAMGAGTEEAAGLWGGAKCWGRKQVATGGEKDEACAVEHLPLTLAPVERLYKD